MIFPRAFRFNKKLHFEYTVKRFRVGKTSLTQIRQLPKIDKHPSDYPSIFDTSEEGLKGYYRQMWYDWVKSLPSVEEKLHEIAVQQRMKLPVYKLSSVAPTYNGVNFQKFLTRTHVINGLPKQLINMNIDQELDEIRDAFCDVLLNHYFNTWEEKKTKKLHDYLTENGAGSKLVRSLISQCYGKLATRNDYILNSSIQQKARIYSFWWHGGYGTEKDEVHERNLCFQYEDYAEFTIRVKQPLLPILDMNDQLCSTAEVIDYHYHPEVFHIPTHTKALASIPGFWPGDPSEFPFLLVHSTDKLNDLLSQTEKYDLNKIEEGFGSMASFAWLNAIASYQGFTPFHDVTYPLVTQTILTNGQDWHFFVYQLNTIAFHNDVDNKDRRNICWSSGRIRLFDTIENGQVKGINEDVFKILLKFLHNVPQLQETDLKPYLGTTTISTDDILCLRYLIRKKYSRVRQKMEHLDEVPTWVKIYKLHPDAPPSPLVRLE